MGEPLLKLKWGGFECSIVGDCSFQHTLVKTKFQ